MVYTGKYENCITDMGISISGDRGKLVGYKGESFPTLAPKLGFWKEWHNNIGIIDEKTNNDFYIIEYYRQVLSKLNPREVLEYLKNRIMMCYEDPNLFCHRHIVAAWLETELGITVPEVKFENGLLIPIERNLEIKESYLRLIKK